MTMFGEYEYEGPNGEYEDEGPNGEAEGSPYREAEEQFLFGGPRWGGHGHRRHHHRHRRWQGDDDEEYESPYPEAEYESPYEAEGAEAEDPFGEAESEGEEQFLPALIPIVGSLLGGLFNKEAEAEYESGYGQPREAEEQFLGNILGGVLGEAGRAASPLSPAQESRLAAELLEVSSEEELEQFLQGVVNTVSRAYHGARNFATSPTGRAVIERGQTRCQGRPADRDRGSWLPVRPDRRGRRQGRGPGDRG